MGDLTEHFSRSEFRCPCGQCNGFPVEPSTELVTALQRMRVRLARPMTITSGVRCEAHNAAVGGVAGSEHTRGEAADLAATTSRERYELVKAAIEVGVKRVGVAKGFVHVGTGREPAAQAVLWLY